MNEQDLKYLLATYQQKSFDLFSQTVAQEAKIRQLTELNAKLQEQLKEQSEKETTTKKSTTTAKKDAGTF